MIENLNHNNQIVVRKAARISLEEGNIRRDVSDKILSRPPAIGHVTYTITKKQFNFKNIFKN